MARKRQSALDGFCEYSIDGEGLTPAAIAASVRGDVDNFIVASTPGGIERQEAQGQVKTVAEDTLPIKMDWWSLQEVGFKKAGRPDELFQPCIFPVGWKKLPFVDDSRWIRIVDGRGRARGSYFYKAAFYDRCAHGSLDSRYGIEVAYPKNGDKVVQAVDRAVKYDEKKGRSKAKVLFKMKVANEERAENLSLFAAAVFLSERFPGWDDVTAYWE